MGMHADQREAIEKRIDEIRGRLAQIEAQVDLEEWKKLFREKLDLERRLKTEVKTGE